MTPQEDKNRVQKLIEQWLAQNNFAVAHHNNDKAFSEISIKYPSGLQLNIQQQKDQSDAVQILSNIAITPDAQGIISTWEPDQVKLAFGELKAELLRMNVQYIFDEEPNVVRNILLLRTVYGESLTKQIFFDALTKVLEATVMSLMKLGNLFGSQVSQSNIDVNSTMKTSPYG